MELLPLTFASGWASGLNAYATVLLLGLLGRFAHTGGIPEGFQRTDVLVVMAVLTLVEFVADKIPYVDSVWDTVSTVVRPVTGALIGALVGGAHGDLTTITLAAVGGVTALLSHLTKAGVRLAVNTSPEPVSNIGVSLGENVAVAGVVALAAAHPVPAAIVAGVILLVGLLVLWLVLSRVRTGWRAVRRRLARTSASGTA
ncbi:MAG TPA: DUF4126 domain-containing protein [Propionibacteriaceae bacterium]|nr:DUF4126 domain-containing protein [Propionibacteriaceae bacterium]